MLWALEVRIVIFSVVVEMVIMVITYIMVGHHKSRAKKALSLKQLFLRNGCWYTWQSYWVHFPYWAK